MTDNHDYYTPDKGTIDWHTLLNDNFRTIDTDVEIRDTEANLEEYEPKPGSKFFATDTENVFFGNETRWRPASTSGHEPRFSSLESNEVNTVRTPAPEDGVAGINDAIDEPGVTVHLRHGVYEANEQLEIPYDNVTIRGGGHKSPEALTGAVEEPGTTIRREIDDAVVALTGSAVKSVAFLDFHVDGNGDETDGGNVFDLGTYAPYARFENVSCQDVDGHVITGDMIHNFRLFHLTARDLGGYLVRIEQTGNINPSWGTMMNCRVTGVDDERGDGVLDADALHLSTLINCTADETADAAFRIRDGFNNLVLNCGVENARSHGFELGDQSEGLQYDGGVIAACWLRGAGGSEDGLHISNGVNVRFEGNTIQDFGGDDVRIVNGERLDWGQNAIETLTSDVELPFAEGQSVRHDNETEIAHVDFEDRERFVVRTGGPIRFFDASENPALTIGEGRTDLEGTDLRNLAKYADDGEAPDDTLYFDETDEQVEYKDPNGTVHELG
ncbi:MULTISPECIES: right-handed parallel beta-helix repeat-containing protein [Natrialbaceae]|uniref:right-handed parallel beta-helix repeat-containing protein n=1 Tax=Natrialbaceae TaxID=1644061 RepID=UPI00207CDACC|nr:right-handed parallel beta-helix repeat-containing protein [Natronococcus sp. CG52]